MNFLTLLFFHFIFDAGLQPSWMIEAKKTNWIVLLEHCFIWTGGIVLGLLVIGEFEVWKIWYLLAGHYLIDLYKIRFSPHPLDKKYLLIDQLLHCLQLYIL